MSRIDKYELKISLEAEKFKNFHQKRVVQARAIKRNIEGTLYRTDAELRFNNQFNEVTQKDPVYIKISTISKKYSSQFSAEIQSHFYENYYLAICNRTMNEETYNFLLNTSIKKIIENIQKPYLRELEKIVKKLPLR